MIRLRVLRYDRPDVVLAECDSPVLPVRGEVLQLDTVDAEGGPAGPSTLWRIISVTVHVPSVLSSRPKDGSALCVRQVEVNVVPDSGLADLLERREAATMTESAI
jgi:hypothetical protein